MQDFRTLLHLLHCPRGRLSKLGLLVGPLSRLEDLQACLSLPKVGPEPEQILSRMAQVFDQHLLLDGRGLLVVRSDLLREFLVLLALLTNLLLKSIEERLQAFEPGDAFAFLLLNDLSR